MVHRVIPSLTLALLLGCTPALITAARAADKPSELSPAEQVRKALDKTIDLDLKEESLQKAVEKFRETTKLNITMSNSNSLSELIAGVAGAIGGGPGFPGGLPPGIVPPVGPGGAVPGAMVVQANFKGVKVRDALKKVFTPYGMSVYIIEDEVLLAPEDVGVRRQLTQRVSLDVDDVPLADVLKRLGRERAINLLVSREGAKGAEKKVSLQLDDVPLETAIRLLADQAGLRAARMDNVLMVTTPEHAKQINADNAARVQPGGAGVPGPGGQSGATFQELLNPRIQQLIERQAPSDILR